MAPHLRDHGVDLDIHPFLTDGAFARLYVPGRIGQKAFDLARGALRRWSEIARARNYDLALIHRELWPLKGQASLSRLRRHQRRWVFDLDDAVFVPNVSEANRAFGALKAADQPQQLAAHSRVVTAGNEWLATWARRQRPAGEAADVVVVPTAVDTDRWAPVARTPAPPRVAWIGSHSTVQYLEPLRPVLARLGQRFPGLELHVIGAQFAADGIRVVAHDWDERTEVALVGACDMAISPLPDTDWARGKCGLKLLLYMALGIPAVASPVGVHLDMLTHEQNGLLADSNEAFERELSRLLASAGLRTRLGTAARVTVESRYSLRAVAPILAAALKRAAASD